MKNILLFLLIAGSIVCNIPANAQLELGLKGGMNYTGFSNHDGGKRFSIHGGLFIHSFFNKKWQIQPELLYSNEGYKYTIIETIDESTQQTERSVSINTVSIPVMFQYFVSQKYFVEAGPQLSITISATDKSASEKLNVKRSLANTQFAMNGGMGYMLGKQMTIYARYSYGLTDITLFDDNVDQNRVIQMGFSFRFTKKTTKK